MKSGSPTLKMSAPPGGLYLSADQRWLALQQRDPAADAQFVYAVATTGIYCRPVCPSRLARRENVAFFNTYREAEQAGFRPCKRCHPTGASQQERHSALVAEACRCLESAETTPSLKDLARAAGLSHYHFLRIFKQVMGVTPRQYAAALRTGRVRRELRGRGSVTAAIYSSGYSSSSRFYERTDDTLGMTPGQFRGGGAGVDIHYAVKPCALGLVLVAGTRRGLCAIHLGAEQGELENELRLEFPRASIMAGDETFGAWVQAVVATIENPCQPCAVPLHMRGTAFQLQVWQALREIPPGTTATYSEIAARIGRPNAARAVAGACADNALAVVIPCHRVVRMGGALSGYRWGVERKRRLLEREKTP